ncbi:hypothetical protein DL96DRAFT_163218 [Flagelloscypha sp. PMI_526]|nr:hypothetical protein DL96DRAFT_163218 [Flagelloscypha sp. PMI_526]
MAGVDRILEGCLQVDRTRPRQNTTQIGAVSGPLVMYGPNHLDLEIDYHEGTAQPLSSSPASRGMSANPQLRYNSFRLRFLCSTAREILAFLTAWSRRYARMTHFPRLRTVRLDVTFDNIPGQRLDDDESLSAWKTIASRLTTGLRMQSKFDVSDDLNPNLVGDSPTADPNGNWGSNLKGITISLKIKTLPQRGELGIDVDLWLKALQELRNFGLALEFQILNTKGTSLWQWKSSRVPST